MVESVRSLRLGPEKHPVFRKVPSIRYVEVEMPNLAQRQRLVLPEIEPSHPRCHETPEDVRPGGPISPPLAGLNGRGKNRIDFFLAGVQKGGTTALAATLRRCPFIRLANNKEVHFFDGSTRNWDDPDYEDYHRWFRPSDPGTVVWGEATPIYFYLPEALKRIHRYNPDARFIICLRHPSLRAHSQWRMETARGNEDWDFSRAITAEGRSRILLGDLEARRHSYVERGLYARQFRHLFSLFPREQVHVLRTDQLWRESEASLAGVCSFLNVMRMETDGTPVYHVPHDSRGVGRMLLTDRQYLDALYRQEIGETEALTGIDLSDWLDPNYEEPMPPPREV